jgi:FkbM family methyltransferase
MTFIKNIIKSLYKISSIKKNLLNSILNDHIVLVDVGSTGGIEDKWKDIEKHLHVISFDPDPRSSTPITKGKFENYQIGLWSKKDDKKLFLKQYPQASTFYKLNEKILSCFLNYPCHKNINEITFKVDKLENILPNAVFFDFIKTDAEGADLEILKGASKYLSNSCMGIQCEVSFINRHKNAPFFSEIDEFLRKQDYILMELESEKWIRKNNIFCSISKPQIIWGNAIYMLSIDSFLKKINSLSDKDRENKISKFITILLIHKFHDYAYELCSSAFINKLVSKNCYLKLKNLIKISIPSSFMCYLKCLFSIFLGITIILLCFLFPLKRKKSIAFFKARIRDFAKLLLNIRYGPYDSCI